MRCSILCGIGTVMGDRKEKGVRGADGAVGLVVFAGTTEGRLLCTFLAAEGISAEAHVATAYGSALLGDIAGISVREGRLDAAEMLEALRGKELVVDATHPYAQKVSENIRQAAAGTGVEYCRLHREESERDSRAIYVKDAAEAVTVLQRNRGNVLLTIGSKMAGAFTTLEGFGQRVFLRILPDEEALAHCLGVGFLPSHMICMQGPFGKALNLATLRHVNAAWLVTKDGGDAGGLQEKMQAAEEAGVQVIVIGRPSEGVGESHSLQQVKKMLRERFGGDRKR